MALTPPKVADLFSDATPKEAAERFEEFSSELTRAFHMRLMFQDKHHKQIH